MDKYGIIYIIRNKLNNKIYVGQTINSFKARYTGIKGVVKYTHNPHLKSSIEKYGVENFEVDEEFDIAYSKEELDKLECLYIDIYNTTNDKYGYNLKLGGANGKPTEKTLERMKVSQRSKLPKIKIICTTTGEIFDRPIDACDKYNLERTNAIIRCCNYQQEYCGKLSSGEKLIWEYYGCYMEKKVFNKKELKQTGKALICITNGQIYKNISEVTTDKCQANKIRICCRGTRKWTKDKETGERLVWRWYRDYLTYGV